MRHDPERARGSATRAAGRGARGAGAASVLLAILLALVAASLLLLWALGPVQRESNPVEFEVMPGWGAARVTEELEHHGLVRSAELFRLYLRLRDLDRSIGAGIYTLDRASGAPEIARRLAAGGMPRTARIVLPEGLRARDVARRLAEAGLGELDAYLELMAQPEGLRRPFMPEDANLEGYLFPAAYEIPVREEPAEVLDRLLRRFEQELTPEVRNELAELGLSVHEWVTIASLVQSEAGSEEEMPIIAGVFLNRLERGMPLQSDPTVAYGLGKDLPELDPLAGDMRRDHPWNTYTRDGLPAGPISNPGRDALQAVLEPSPTAPDGAPYLYFLHGFEGSQEVFRPNTNLADHNRDVERYLRGAP